MLSSSPTPIAGAFLVVRHPRADSRGYFERMFCAESLQALGWQGAIAQINHSYTRQAGALRGMHYQLPPHAEYKLVSCLRGEVWDVLVDLRYGSPTFLQWHAARLTPANGHALLIPPGCAHGFQTLSEDVEMLYCHSASYVPTSEAGVFAQDARLQINWPVPVSQMSEKDAAYLHLSADFQGVKL